MAAGDKHIETKTQGINITEEEITKLKALSDISQDMRDALDSAASTLGVSEKVFEEILEHLEDIREDSGNIFDDAESYYDTLKSISSILRDNLETLTKGRSPVNETKSITTQLVHEAEKLQQIRNLGNLISVAEYNTEKSKLELDKVRLESLGKQLGFNESIATVVSDRNSADLEKSSLLGNISAEESEVKRLQIRIKEIGKAYSKAFSYDSTSTETKSLENKLGLYKQLLTEQEKGLEKDRSRLAVLDDMAAVLSLQAEYEKEKDISRLAVDEARSVTGNTPLKTKIMRTAGLQDLAEKEQFASDETQKAAKSAYTVAKEAGKSEKEAWEIAHTEGEKTYKALRPKWDDLGKVLKNAAVSWFLTNAIKLLNQLDEIASNLKQRIGSWEIATAAVNSQLITATEYLKFATELTDDWAINPITVFSESEIGKMAGATKLLGLSSKEAQNLGIFAKLAGQDADSFEKSINRGYQSYAKTNRSAIAFGNVQREVLRTSDAIRLSLGGNGEALAKAANAALELGMNMKDVEEIMNSLINFESSIESEMTAQLLTGNQLNLAKARELALNNDIAGVANEIKKQGIDAAWWGRANRIQQENMAKALGMSRDQMARMLVVQELQNKASEAQLAANMGITAEEVKSISMAETWKSTINKLGEAFVPILTALRPAIDLLALAVKFVAPIISWISSLGGLLDRTHETTSKWYHKILGISFILPVIGRGFLGIFTGIGGLVGGLGKAYTSASMLLLTFRKMGDGNILKGIGRTFTASASRAFNAGRAGNIAKAASGSAATTAAGTTAQTTKGRGSNLPVLGNSIAKFLRAFNKVTVGMIGKATLAALAFVPIAASSPAIALASVVGPSALKGLPTLGRGIASFLRTFNTVTVGMIGKALLAATAFIPVAALSPAIMLASAVGSLASEGLPTLGRGIAGFFRASSKITAGMIGKAALASITLVPVAVAAPLIAIASAIGPLASKGLPALGRGIAGFFTALSGSAAAVVSALPAIAVITVAAIGIGFALKLVAPALEALGNLVHSVFSGVSGLIESFASSLSILLESVTPEKALGIVTLGLALVPFSTGLLAAVTPIALFPISKFGRILDQVTKLKGLELGEVGSMFSGLASGISTLASAVDKLNVAKLSALSALGFVSKLAGVKVGGPVEIPVESQTTQSKIVAGKIEEAETRATVAQSKSRETQKTEIQQTVLDLSRVETMLGQLLGAVKDGKNIYLNGDKVGQTLAWSTTSM